MGSDEGGWPLGRAGILRRLIACAERLERGDGDALVLRGEVGMGVTTLLDSLEAAAVSAGVAVRRARGRSAECTIDGAVLHELASNGHPGVLSERLRRSDPTIVELADAVLAVDEPTVVIIDDAHVADAVSLRVLFFAAHRCADHPLGIVIGGRQSTWGVDDGGVERLDLAPLDAFAIRAIAAGVAGHDVDADVAVELCRATGGNPLATIEIARRLRPEQLDGTETLPLGLSPGGPIGDVFAAPLRQLDASARRALFVAAAEPSGDLRTIGMALAVLGDNLDGLAPAEEAGVVELSDGRVAFDHPLRRAAAYHLLAAPSRRTAHRALALACDRPADGERRVEHLDLATLAPDEAVAKDMEHVARSAEQAGDLVRAARWWARAAALSPSPTESQRRQHRATTIRQSPHDPLVALTPAERRVAEAVGSGLANKEAAAALHVSVKTVDAHLQAIYRKLSVRSRTELALLVNRSSIATVEGALA